MATDAQNIQTRLSRVYAELAALETIAADDRATMTYSDGQQSYDYNAYVSLLTDQAERLEKLYGTVLARTAGPWNVNTGTVRG
jgi:hypothetical protein